MGNDTPKTTDASTSVWSGEFRLFGVTVHCHVLSDGRRIIEADDAAALFEVMAGGPVDDEDDAVQITRFAEWMKGHG